MPHRALRRLAFSILVLLVSLPAAAAISYGAPSFPATGVGPIAIAVADFNGDCNPDFATADFSSGTVTVRFGDGAGGFPTAHTITGLSDPESIVAGDFNGDGKIDLAVGNVGAFTPLLHTIQIYLNDGAGNFTLQAGTLSASSRPHAFLAADFNEDGKLDLVAPDASGGGSGVIIFFGNGNGTFSAGTHVDVLSPASSSDAIGLAAADLNGDGHLDIASANGATLSWIFGNGNGTFGTPNVFTYPSPMGEGGAVAVAAADLNHDGHIDLATAGGNVVAGASIFINSGTGTFTRTQYSMPQAPANPISVTLADLDGDGNIDIVTADQFGCTPWGSNLAARPGNGDGTFGAAQVISVGYGPTCIDSHWQPNDVAAVDLNCDGKMDLIAPNMNKSFVSVMLTAGGSPAAPTVTAPPPVSTSSGLSCSAVVSNVQLGTAIAHSTCGCAVIVRTGVPAGNIFPVGVTVVTYTATDSHGNTGTATQNVTVSDATPPTISAPANITTAAGPSCNATVSVGSPVANDNCPGVTTSATRSDAQPLANAFPVGTTTVAWTALDAHGNTATATQTVTVDDTTPPTITAPANITVTAGPSCTATVSLGTPVASDNCAGVSTSATRSDGQPLAAPFSIGTTTVTYTAMDAHGSTASATQTVIVNAPPVTIGSTSASPNVLWPPNHKMVDITVNYTTLGGCGSVNCSITSITSNEPLNGNGDGNTPVDWQIVDAHHVRLRAERSGNGSGRVYMITITCSDGGGHTATSTVTVTVAKNN